MQNHSKHFTTPRIIMLCLATVAIFILLSGLKRPIMLPTTSLTMQAVDAIASSEKGTVISDKSSTRLIFLNDKKEVINIVNLGGAGSPFDKAHTLALASGNVYAIGTKLIDGGIFIDSEIIAEYDLEGNFLQEIYKEKYAADTFIPKPRFANLFITNDSIILTKLTGLTVNHLSFHSPYHDAPSVQTLNTPERLRHIFYLEQNGDMLLLSASGWFYHYQAADNSFNRQTQAEGRSKLLNHYGLPAAAGNIVFRDNYIPLPSMLSRLTQNINDCLYYADHRGNLQSLSVSDNTTSAVSTLPLAGNFLARLYLFWGSVIYLSVLILYALFKIICSLKTNLSLRHTVMTSLLMIAIAGGITVYYTYSTFSLIHKQYDSLAVSRLNQLEQIVTEFYTPLLSEIEQQGAEAFFQNPDNRTKIATAQGFFYDYMRQCENNGGFYATLMLRDSSGNYYNLLDSSDKNITGALRYTADMTSAFREIHTDGTVYKRIGKDDIYRYAVKFLGKNKSTAELEVGYVESKLNHEQRQFAIDTFVNLLAILLMLYIFQKTWLLFQNNYHSYREARQKGEDLAYIEFYPLLYFLRSQSSYTDGIIFVFIIKQLCGGIDMAQTAFYAALVPGMYSAGMLLGAFLTPILKARISNKIYGVIGSVICIGSFALMVTAISLGSIYLFLFAKFIQGLMLDGLLFTWISLLPLSFEGEKRVSLTYSGRRAVDIAMILAYTLGGYSYQYLNHVAVYAYMSLSILVILAIILFTFKNDPLVTASNSTDTLEKPSPAEKNSWGFFLIPAGIISIVFVAFAIRSGRQYGSYLFPVMAAGAGISTIMTSNLSVFSKTFSIIIRDYIIKLKSSLGTTSTLIFSLAIIGSVYLFFLANDTFLWGVIGMVIIHSIFDRGDATLFVSDMAEKCGYDPKKVMPHFAVLDSLSDAVVPIVMSAAITTLGLGMGCTMVGIFFFISIAAIILLKKKYT